MDPKIKVRFKAYDDKLLDQTVGEIVHTVRRTGAQIVGPIPLPTRINKYTVLRSPHVDKKSRHGSHTPPPPQARHTRVLGNILHGPPAQRRKGK